jgi:nucleotide-binding universal stress UspA family protein
MEVTVMEASASGKIQHLSLDNLAVNPRLARRLTPTLACRYHALPVAEDGDLITVVMANPDDAAALEAISAALGAKCCVVRGDPAAIDALLAEVWPEEAPRSLRLLVCTQASPMADELRDYAQAIGNLLSAHVGCFQATDDAFAIVDALDKEAGYVGHDLVVFAESDQLLVERLLSYPTDGKTSERMLSSLLLARQPRWPLRKILLVIRGKELDDSAVDWVVRLAGPSGAAVTVLTTVLPAPATYGREARSQPGLNALLTTDTALGQQMRRVAQRLVNWEIESTLRLCQGLPGQRIRREIAEGDYDLIAVAAEPSGLSPRTKPQGQWSHQLPGELALSLLRWSNQPVLIARREAT